jgi:general secretion pathway protein B
MSILLEALKKSEQERQLGQTPTLQTRPEEPLRGDGSMNQWIILSLGVLSACVMAWFGWQQFRVSPGAEAPAIAARTTEDITIPQEEAPKHRTMTELYQANYGKRTSSDTLQPEQTKSEPDDRDRLSRSVSTFTAENEGSEPAVKTDEVTAVAEPRPTPAGASAPAKTIRSPAATSPAVAKDKTRRTGIEPHITEPISYWELPQAIRDGMPEIRITVLVYAEKPDDRFLLSNGQRLVEKEELDGGLVLDEIRKDGAVFLYRNYRFLVKG